MRILHYFAAILLAATAAGFLLPQKAEAQTCVRANPTVTITPALQNAILGETKTFQTTILNNDSTACAPTAFTLALTFTTPSDLTANLSASSVTLAPKTSQVITTTINVPLTTVISNYMFRVRATNSVATGFFASASANINVQSAPPCVPASPLLSITPNTQSGAPGEIKSYTLTLLNNDSATCASTTFALSALSTAELNVGLSLDQLALMPGQSASFTADVQSLATLVASATYPFNVRADDAAVASHMSLITGQYSVVVTAPPPVDPPPTDPPPVACQRANPTVTISPASQTSRSGENVTYQLSIKNNDSSTCLNSTMGIELLLPAELMGSLDMQSLVLAPQSSGLLSARIIIPAGTAPNTYMFRVRATNNDSIGFFASSTANVTVINVPVCTPVAPLLSISPAVQSGLPGESKVYNLTLQNADSSDCPATTFTISNTLPSQLTAQFSQNSLTVLAGQSATFTATVKSSELLTSSADYQFSISALDLANSTHGAQTTATYSVNVVVIPANPPTAPTGVSINKKGKEFEARWRASKDNVRVVKYIVYIDGKAIGETRDTRLRFRTSCGVHTLVVRAQDNEGNLSVESTPVSFTCRGKSQNNSNEIKNAYCK